VVLVLHLYQLKFPYPSTSKFMFPHRR